MLATVFLGLLLAAPTPVIRVALLKEASGVVISGPELQFQLPEAKPVSYSLESPVRIKVEKNSFTIGSNRVEYPSAKILSRTGKLTVEGKTFAGILEVRRLPDQKLLLINEVPLETYLIGLIHGELNAAWPMETIKAQTVAARTYALARQQQQKSKQPLFDLEATILDQVYVGSKGDSDARIEQALRQTKGEVLWFLGLHPAYYHSCCGGQTELAGHVWGKNESSQSKIDPYCQKSPQREWSATVSTKEFLEKLKPHGLEGVRLQSVSVERHDDTPRNALITVETDRMTLFLKATDFRKIFGFQEIKSTWFTVQQNNGQIVFSGKGYGHGVGLCQWGAKAMAEQGWGYKKIL